MPYKVRKTTTGRGHDYCTLHVPNAVARLVPDEERFEPELTDEGILYRRVKLPKHGGEPPKWAHRAA